MTPIVPIPVNGIWIPAASPMVANIMRVLIIVLLPVFIVIGAVRVLLSDAYTTWAYTNPEFPADVLGQWTPADRKLYSDYARLYISDPSLSLEFLAGTPFSDKAYNERELVHMDDVQVVTVAALQLWTLSAMVVVFGGAWLALPIRTRQIARSAFMIGSGIVIVVLLSLLLFIFVDFNTFFTAFHNVFFEPGTWLFYEDDNLIRLFPLKFWNDIFIWLAASAFGAALTIFGMAAWVLRPISQD